MIVAGRDGAGRDRSERRCPDAGTGAPFEASLFGFRQAAGGRSLLAHVWKGSCRRRKNAPHELHAV